MKQSLRAMVEKIDFYTSFGHGEGGDHRKRLSIETAGPTLLITDLAVWKPHPETKEFTVVSLHPGGNARGRAEELRLESFLRRRYRGTTPAPTRARTPDAARSAEPRTKAAARARRKRPPECPKPSFATTSAPRSAVSAVLCRPSRPDDLGAIPLKALVERNKDVDWQAVDFDLI